MAAGACVAIALFTLTSAEPPTGASRSVRPAAVATTIWAAVLILAGSLATRAGSAACDAAGVLPEVVGVDSELEPQALRARPTIAAPAVRVTTGERRLAIRSIPSTEAGLT